VTAGDRPRKRTAASKLRYGGQLAWWLVRNPVENAARLREARTARRSGWRADVAYPVQQDWEQELHVLLGVPWPCEEAAAFTRAWETAVGELAQQGIIVGREAFGGWDDGDRALARAAWCVVRHSTPRRMVETGVGRGLTSRIILEAMESNGHGRLWSVDQPPPFSPLLRRQTGAAVPERLRPRWTYVRGTSRRRLPGLIRQLETLDAFLHDSMHSTRNVEFELDCALPALRPGGALLVDDIDMNQGVERFAQRHGESLQCLVGISDDGQRRFALIVKPPAEAAPSADARA
jgi:methyltransferase family protein